jgi:hypothetical protein
LPKRGYCRCSSPTRPKPSAVKDAIIVPAQRHPPRWPAPTLASLVAPRPRRCPARILALRRRSTASPVLDNRDPASFTVCGYATTAMRSASSRRSAARDRPHKAAVLRARLLTLSHRRLPSPTPAVFTALRRLPRPRGHRPAASQPAVERTWSPAALGLDDSARLPEDSDEDARSGSGFGRRCRPPVRRWWLELATALTKLVDWGLMRSIPIYSQALTAPAREVDRPTRLPIGLNWWSLFLTNFAICVYF